MSVRNREVQNTVRPFGYRWWGPVDMTSHTDLHERLLLLNRYARGILPFYSLHVRDGQLVQVLGGVIDADLVDTRPR